MSSYRVNSNSSSDSDKQKEERRSALDLIKAQRAQNKQQRKQLKTRQTSSHSESRTPESSDSPFSHRSTEPAVLSDEDITTTQTEEKKRKVETTAPSALATRYPSPSPPPPLSSPTPTRMNNTSEPRSPPHLHSSTVDTTNQPSTNLRALYKQKKLAESSFRQREGPHTSIDLFRGRYIRMLDSKIRHLERVREITRRNGMVWR